MAAESIVQVENLCAMCGARTAINDLSFGLSSGRTLALIGPNGAGKSTLFRVLLGLHLPASGEASLFGQSSQSLAPETLARLAYVPETHAEDPRMRVVDLEHFREEVYPRFDRAFFAELSAGFALRRDARVSELSRGQRAGLVVGLALAQRPELLLLDDPLLGLDPLARRRVVEAILARTAEGGFTTVISAHELGDIERVADDVLLIGRGRARPLVALVDLLDNSRLLRVSTTTSIAALEALPHVIAVDPKREGIDVVLDGPSTGESVASTEQAIRALDPTPSELEALSFEQIVLAWLAQESRKEMER